MKQVVGKRNVDRKLGVWHLDVAQVLGRQVVSVEPVEAVAPSETPAWDSEEQDVGELSEVILRSKEQRSAAKLKLPDSKRLLPSWDFYIAPKWVFTECTGCFLYHCWYQFSCEHSLVLFTC